MAKRLEAGAAGAAPANLTGIDVDAASKLLDDLVDARHDIAKANQAAGQIVKKAEKELGCNTAAFKLIMRLETAGADAQNDFMRTFLPLAQARGIEIRKDLVDQMEA